MFDLLIVNGNVVSSQDTKQLDIAVLNGKIAALSPTLKEDAKRKIDASGKLVFPGIIDAHTHMGIPIMNTRSADDFKSGSIAAACGGVTTIIDFTVQEPRQTLRDSIEVRKSLALGKSHIDFGLHVNVTNQPRIRTAEIPELCKNGFSAYKVFSTYRQVGMMISWPEFKDILSSVNQNSGLLFLHAEDNDLVESKTEANVAAGNTAAIFHPRSRTAQAEAKAIENAAQIVLELNARLYIVHLSSKAGLEAALSAKAKGAKLILETCPQYLVLTEDFYKKENGHYWITTPPLRTQADSEALWQALTKGQIDVVATDHCPFTQAQKNDTDGKFHLTPNGIPGVETLFPLLYTYGVHKGKISPERLVELLAKKPAELFGISDRKGQIQVGADADLVIWDPNVEQVIKAENLHGNADWSPFESFKIQGNVNYTIARGNVLVENSRFVGKNHLGQLLLSS